MNPQHFELLKGLVNPNYVEQAAQARNSRSKHFTALFTQRRLPDVGWKEEDIQSLLEEMASFDTNNFEGNVGVGEREGRVYSDLVRRRHFGLTHGIGRSGDVMAEQPKAAGSSLLVQLTKYLALDAIRLAGIKAAKACAVLPAATGLTMTLVFLALRQMRPQGKYVIWSRIDQKSCFKAIGAAGLKPIVIELKPIEGSDALGTDVQGIRSAIERVGAEEVLCICCTTSTFAPRVPDFVDEVAVLASELAVPHVINNAYGLQCSKCTHLIETGCRRGRVDAFVQSTDKNFLVPVGGAIVAGPTAALVDKVSGLYPGRASMSPLLDLFITLLSLGSSGWTGLLQERKENAKWFEERLSTASTKLGLRVLKVPANRISFCIDISALGREYRAAQEQLVEALMVLPFAEECLEPHAKPKWPLSVFDVHSNYIRFYRAMSYYHETAELLEDLLWQPTRTCVDDMGCEGLPDHFCSRLHRCVPRHGCPRNAEECPLGERCTALSSYGDGCSLQLSPLCVQHGELQAFHPHSACLSAAEFPHMIKACSEMGTTLYPLKWSSSPYASYRDRIQGGSALAQPKDAFILPVTLRLRSPWHMLHSLVPAYAQSHMDERYGLAKLAGDFDLLIVDQDLDKDTHIWQQVFRNASGDSMGGLDFLLRLISHRPYKLLAQAEGCYERAVWGHELMLYSGGGWTSELHMAGFVRAAWRLDGRARRDSKDAPRLLLVERRNGTSWGRWIDNFPDVQSTAQSWADEHEDLLGGVEAADLADFSWPEQLRMAARMRLLFGAHGDGLSWSVFMGPGSAVLEAVPARGAGFQARGRCECKPLWHLRGGRAVGRSGASLLPQ
ncbi:unnamed protein product [Effrenium voratum]|uniref:O-phosphoseryl-tRNA(Sec) selenium transferase n=1 Tax=Effrenium voratum TaxID=2562239 RepID=A0AA36N9H4_9DINO|nr:unnamed protein product [Effrenium voratum]CAJ1429815.1 unnamed protein product [Effrenium voratum]